MFGSSFDILYESLPFYFHQFKTLLSGFQVFSVSCESGAYRLNGAPPARTGAKLNESFKKNCVLNRSNLNHQFDAMSKNPSLQSLPLLNVHRVSFDYKTIHCYFLRSKRGHSGSKQKRAKTGWCRHESSLPMRREPSLDISWHVIPNCTLAFCETPKECDAADRCSNISLRLTRSTIIFHLCPKSLTPATQNTACIPTYKTPEVL